MPHVELPQAEFKVVLLGDTNTGKTSLVLRFVEGYYRDRSPTIGAFFLTKRITVGKMTTCKLLLWDTAGQAPFQKLAQTYYQTAAAAVLTFDVSQPQSLHRLRLILQEVLQVTAGRRMVLTICACKADLDPSLHAPGLTAEAQTLAQQHGALYVETSARNNQGVADCFEQTAERVWQWHKESANGMGLPIPVTVGGTISNKQAQQLRSRTNAGVHMQPEAKNGTYATSSSLNGKNGLLQRNSSPNARDTRADYSKSSSTATSQQHFHQPALMRMETPPPATPTHGLLGNTNSVAPLPPHAALSVAPDREDHVVDQQKQLKQQQRQKPEVEHDPTIPTAAEMGCEGLLTCSDQDGAGCCIS